MSIETVKMSSKGQVVIPRDIRDSLRVDEGSVFAVISTEDSVILKKLATPSKEELISELKKIAEDGKKHLKSLGVKEEDIPKIVERSRRK